MLAVPMFGVGGGVGMELHLTGNQRLSVHTLDIDALQTALDRHSECGDAEGHAPATHHES